MRYYMQLSYIHYSFINFLLATLLKDLSHVFVRKENRRLWNSCYRNSDNKMFNGNIIFYSIFTNKLKYSNGIHELTHHSKIYLYDDTFFSIHPNLSYDSHQATMIFTPRNTSPFYDFDGPSLLEKNAHQIFWE